MATLLQLVKIKVTITLTLISTLTVAQNFAPFNANVSKRFYNSATPSDNSYFFYADSSHSPGSGITILHQYFTLQFPATNINTQSCGFWTNGALYVTDTTWLGVDIVYNSTNQHLKHKNVAGDTLKFDFSILPGDSSKFYESTAHKYYIKAGSSQNETLYSVTDAVKTFTILHYNASNQVVNSLLHGKQIKLGQQTGLIQFIDTYHFPTTEKHLVLKGQLNPLIGSYQMRFEDLYPFQVGDSMQYSGGNSMACSYIRNYRVTSRLETSSSVTISLSNSIYNAGVAPLHACSVPNVYPNVLTFQKNSDILGFPFNRLLGNTYPLTNGPGFEIRNESTSNTNCGNRLTYMGDALSAAYCSSCVCVGSKDKFNMALPTIHYAMGLGVSNLSIATFTSGQTYNNLNLKYSSVSGTVCGTYFPVGLPKHILNKFALYPNPVKDELTINTPIDQLSIFSADGTAVQSFFQPASTIALGHLPPGLYILHLRKADRVEYTRIIKL